MPGTNNAPTIDVASGLAVRDTADEEDNVLQTIERIWTSGKEDGARKILSFYRVRSPRNVISNCHFHSQQRGIEDNFPLFRATQTWICRHNYQTELGRTTCQKSNSTDINEGAADTRNDHQPNNHAAA